MVELWLLDWLMHWFIDWFIPSFIPSFGFFSWPRCSGPHSPATAAYQEPVGNLDIWCNWHHYLLLWPGAFWTVRLKTGHDMSWRDSLFVDVRKSVHLDLHCERFWHRRKKYGSEVLRKIVVKPADTPQRSPQAAQSFSTQWQRGETCVGRPFEKMGVSSFQ